MKCRFCGKEIRQVFIGTDVYWSSSEEFGLDCHISQGYLDGMPTYATHKPWPLDEPK